MGGGGTNKKTTQTKQKSREKTQSVTKAKTAQTTVQGPYKPAQAPINNLISAAGNIPGSTSTAITPAQEQAVSGLERNAAYAQENYNPQQQQLISDLYSGQGLGNGVDEINASYDASKNALNPYLDKGFLDPNTNPYLQPALNNLFDDTYNGLSDRFAAGGRSLSGDFAGSFGKQYSAAANPLLMNQYNTNMSAQLQAANMLPQQAIDRASALDSTALNRLNARVGATGQINNLNAPYMQGLAAADIRAALPYTNLNYASQFLTPLAQLGSTGQSNGTSSSTTNSQTRGVQTGMTTETTPGQSPWMTAAGLLGTGAGIVGGTGGFGATGWLTNAFKPAA